MASRVPEMASIIKEKSSQLWLGKKWLSPPTFKNGTTALYNVLNAFYVDNCARKKMLHFDRLGAFMPPGNSCHLVESSICI